MESANKLRDAGFHSKEDVFKKLHFTIEQIAAFELWVNYTADVNYRQGKLDGKDEIQNGIKELLGLSKLKEQYQ
jgi:hypothetical protein